MRMSENKFASEIGVNTQTLNNYTTGKRSVSYDVVDKILVHFPQVSAEWLIRGIGNMLNGCGCTSTDTDDSFYHPSQKRTTSEPEAKEERRTSEDLLAKENELLRQQVQFLKEQVDFYKNKDKQ